MLPKRRCAVLCGCAITSALPLTLMARSAQALSFRFDFDRKVPDDFQAAAQEAADVWSSVLKDDVVVDLRIEYTDLSSFGPVLGGAQPGKVKVKYEDYVDALFRDATSANDLSALNSLPLSSEGRQIVQSFQPGSQASKGDLKSETFAFLIDGQFGNGSSRSGPSFVDDNRSANNKNVLLTRAQARALGLDKGNRKLDGLIKLNSDVEWDMDRRDGVDADRYDAVSVLQHEIGHALGVVVKRDGAGRGTYLVETCLELGEDVCHCGLKLGRAVL